MHDTLSLRRACQSDVKIAPLFWDVFGADEIPCGAPSYPKCAIANTDPIRRPGQHWVAVYWDAPEQGEFFDSYAMTPSTYYQGGWQCFDPMEKNPYPIQQWSSDVCGDYCLYYLYHRCRGKSLREIVKPFSPTDLQYNDMAVVERVLDEFPNLTHDHKLTPFKGPLDHQICTKRYLHECYQCKRKTV